MLKFKFLGANGSCQDADCGNTSLLFTDGTGSLCIDLACNISSVVDADIDAVLLTHEHIDHIYALPSLLHQLWLTGRTKPLTIYLPAGLDPFVNGMIDLFSIRSKKNIFDIVLSHEERFTVGGMHFQTFKTDHTPISVGVIVEEGGRKLVYTGDSRPIPTAPEFMSGAQVLIHEASGLESNEQTLIQKGHSSAADAGRLAAVLGVGQMYLCHLPRGIAAKQALLSEARALFPAAYLPGILTEYTL